MICPLHCLFINSGKYFPTAKSTAAEIGQLHLVMIVNYFQWGTHFSLVVDSERPGPQASQAPECVLALRW